MTECVYLSKKNYLPVSQRWYLHPGTHGNSHQRNCAFLFLPTCCQTIGIALNWRYIDKSKCWRRWFFPVLKSFANSPGSVVASLFLLCHLVQVRYGLNTKVPTSCVTELKVRGGAHWGKNQLFIQKLPRIWYL